MTTAKSMFSKDPIPELIILCNDTVISAARDLAVFTRNGINAQFIVSLAGKCRELEKINDPKTPPHSSGKQTRLVAEIRTKLIELSNAAYKIWKDQPAMYNNYVLPSGFGDDFLDAAAVA